MEEGTHVIEVDRADVITWIADYIKRFPALREQIVESIVLVTRSKNWRIMHGFSQMRATKRIR